MALAALTPDEHRAIEELDALACLMLDLPDIGNTDKQAIKFHIVALENILLARPMLRGIMAFKAALRVTTD